MDAADGHPFGEQNAKKDDSSFEKSKYRDVYRPERSNPPQLPRNTGYVLGSPGDEVSVLGPRDLLKCKLLMQDARDICLTSSQGFGKATILLGLAHDFEVRHRFPAGILFITLGPGVLAESAYRFVELVWTRLEHLYRIVLARAQRTNNPTISPELHPAVSSVVAEIQQHSIAEDDGLPMAAAVAGCAIGYLARPGNDYKLAYRQYVLHLRQKRNPSWKTLDSMISRNL